MAKVLVLGATGATGSLVVKRLLNSGHEVVMIVRSKSRLSQEVLESAQVIEGDISSFSDEQLLSTLQGCDGCVSCLGHNLTFNGMFGEPRQLVTGVVKQLVRIKKACNRKPFKFVLMSSSGVQSHTIKEHPPISQRIVVSILRVLLPPHRDNELAAKVLVNTLNDKSPAIDWVVVRPDTLVDQPLVSSFETYGSPIRNAIFNAGQTSRVNVAEFMCRLLTDGTLWDTWKHKMPVIYNKDGLA